MAAIRIQLGKRQSSMLAAAAPVTALAVGGLLFRFATEGQDLLIWCRDYVLANIGGGPVRMALSAGIVIVAAASVLNAGVFLVTERLRSHSLRREMRRRAMPLPGRVASAASSVGAAGLALAIADGTPAAFTVGLLSPRIVVTTGLLSVLTREGLKAVLSHELSHLRRRDPLRSLLWETLCRTLFFLPVLRDVSAFAAVQREIVADASAERSAGRHALASALLRIVSWEGRAPAGIASFGHIRRRIDALGSPSSGRSMEFARSRLLATALVTAAILSANAAYASPNSRDGTAQKACGDPSAAHMSQINFSPYLRIEVEKAQMSSAVQSPAIAP